MTQDILSDATLRQRQAADPAQSVWVSASAGSGKTKVLTDRVLNLLLRGAAPGKLLCLTFTKAAAAEMANRVNARLSAWAVASDSALRVEIETLTGDVPAPELYDQARRLFARVLDTPGGMRIMTIHAFCQSILRRFPLESGVAPNFDIADDRTAAELQLEARNAVLIQARMSESEEMAGALSIITAHIAESRFDALMGELKSHRGKLAARLRDAGGLDAYLADLWWEFDLEPGTTSTDLIAIAADDSRFDGPALRNAASALANSPKSVTNQRRGDSLARWLSGSSAERIAGWDDYVSAYLTQRGEVAARLATNDLIKAHSWLEPALRTEALRVQEVQTRIAAARTIETTAALTRFADSFLKHYAMLKRQHGVMDYEDLILSTRDLLTQPGIAPWVLFKLDGGIDHVLIDEAQDTNPDQWSVIEALVGEFFAGDSARPQPRTVFAVGDPKQSIFSFQGADPQRFLDMGRRFTTLAAAARQSMSSIPLDVSFRSTAAILQTVDAVFAAAPATDGVMLDGVQIRHLPNRAGIAGHVELWVPEAPETTEEPKAWELPATRRRIAAPHSKLAIRIAETITTWLAEGTMLAAKGRPIRAGDILILVRRRNAFVTELIRALKQQGVAVAGADRIVLDRQLAVMDLLALARFLLLPEDDLNLACLLKSPLFGFDDDDLFPLCHERGRATLWHRLQNADTPKPVQATVSLRELLARADFISPHGLFAEVLGAGGGRCKLVGRLGPEAADAIDEFLNQTLAYERAHVPSLQGFVSWLEQGDSQIKRDLDQGARDEVRIMTVHGSKGLQAPVVFLPDTVSKPKDLPILLWHRDRYLLWAPGEAGMAPQVAAAKAEAMMRRDQEYHRLLYVALTRAEDRLQICGWRGSRTSPSGNWHELIDTALRGLPGIEIGEFTPSEDAPFARSGLLFKSGDPVPTVMDIIGEDRSAELPLPAFAKTAPMPEPVPPRPLTALRPAVDDPPARSPLRGSQDEERRYKRGTIIHRLLQTLPDLPRVEAGPAAQRYLARPALGLDPAEQETALSETLAVLDHPEFGALFGPGSLAEVPVAGLVGDRVISGRIDRLIVTPQEIVIADYKTNRPPARTVAEIPLAYVEQLAAYRAALAQIYPDRRIRTVLLWTVGPWLMEVPE